jgi:hypothetical protein
LQTFFLTEFLSVHGSIGAAANLTPTVVVRKRSLLHGLRKVVKGPIVLEARIAYVLIPHRHDLDAANDSLKAF